MASCQVDGCYDVCARIGVSAADRRDLGFSIVRSISDKGFCVINSNAREDALHRAQKELAMLRASFEPPPDEIVEALLGAEGSQRVLELAEESAPEVLDVLDQYMSSLAAAVEPVSHHLGFQLQTRTTAMLHEASRARDDFPDITHAEALRWLSTFNLHRIMCLGFLGPGEGTLMLRPLFDDECGVHVIDTEPGMWVFLRADLLHHTFGSDSYRTYVMSCWLLENYAGNPLTRAKPTFPPIPAAAVLEKLVREPVDEPGDLPRAAEHVFNHHHHKGMRILVQGASCRFPTGLDIPKLWPVLCKGLDSAVKILHDRWDHDALYDPDPSSVAEGKIPCMHAAFVEGIELFDNKVFGITPNETKTLAPEQRQVLEIALETMYDGGFTKESMSKTNIGVYAGATWPEWNLIQPSNSPLQGAFGTTSNMTPISSNRVSFAFGLQGPSMSLDTEGSSALVAVCRGSEALMSDKDHSLCLGISLILASAFMLLPARARALSERGRCFAFDICADGYICGDGCAGVLLSSLRSKPDNQKALEDTPSRGIINAANSVNVGVDAAVARKRAESDVKLLAGALKVASISPLDVDGVDCNAVGEQSSDALEVIALSKALRDTSKKSEPLLLSASKSCLANMRTCAGMGGLLQTLANLSVGASPSTCHLRTLHSNRSLDVHAPPVIFQTEMLLYRGTMSYSGVTAKGFGGTSAHALCWGEAQAVPLQGDLRHHVDIVYWPGGGGELPEEAYPEWGYAIIGSWTAWTRAERMEEEMPGIYGYTLTLGEHCLEKFLILLDGKVDCVLHPSAPQSGPETRVFGPTSSGAGLDWTIGGRSSVQDDWRQSGSDKVDEPGDKYRIRLRVAGKWRVVGWEKLPSTETKRAAEPGAHPHLGARYFISASWNDWGLDEMVADNTGCFHAEVRLLRPGGSFLLVVNRDWSQVLHPGLESGEAWLALGPDPAEAAVRKWHIDGRPGDVFRVEFQVFTQAFSSFEEEAAGVCKMVSWSKVGHEALNQEELQSLSRTRYFIIGSWNKFSRTHEMTWNRSYYMFVVKLGTSGEESFQILTDGDVMNAVHPAVREAHFHDHPRVRQGPYGSGMYWTIGRHALDAASPGQMYEVRLHVMNQRNGKVPSRIEWLPTFDD